jgi:hypothetical protein
MGSNRVTVQHDATASFAAPADALGLRPARALPWMEGCSAAPRDETGRSNQPAGFTLSV